MNNFETIMFKRRSLKTVFVCLFLFLTAIISVTIIDKRNRGDHPHNFTMHHSSPNDFFVIVLSREKLSDSPMWFVNGRHVSKPELTAVLGSFKTAGINSLMIKATGDVPISWLSETLDILRETGFERVNLWNDLDCKILTSDHGDNLDSAELKR